jgi:UDP-N-acetylglucosamine 2-epimerase (non-hydrolysing)
MKRHTPMKKHTIVCLGGARPNFMKLAPVVAALDAAPDFESILVHSGQHYDQALSGQFFRDLGLRDPDFHLEAGSGTHGAQTARVLERFEGVLEGLIAEGRRPDGVLVVGDVNSTLAGALAAAKLGIPVIHAEAGLRSFDRSMPEEINRLATDAVSDLLLASEESGMRNLRHEGIPERRLRLVGNLMIDSLARNLDAARASGVQARLGIPEGGRYGVVTLHRAANVDDPAQLGELFAALGEIAGSLELYFPVHPRTRARLAAAGLAVPPRLRLIEPLGYHEFLGLVAGARAVLTDSGGIQEETTALGIVCLTLRNNTERPATLTEGTNHLAGTRRERILAVWRSVRARVEEGAATGRPARVPQGWDGRAAERTLEALREFQAWPASLSQAA